MDNRMDSKSVLKDKVVLIVDDEPDILDTVAEMLETCIVHKASDYDEGRQLLLSYTFDIVILDIMGVNGFELLKHSVKRGFPTVMLTAHALTPESLEKSMKLGAVSFLPKDKIVELKDFLEDVVLGEGKPVWKRLFDRLGTYFEERFGQGWEKRLEYLEEFKKSYQEAES